MMMGLIPGLLCLMYSRSKFPAVVYINALNWWVNGAGYNAVNTLLEMKAAGWEVSNHTYNHDLGVTETNVSQMKSWLDSHEFPNSGFASPNNDWSHSRVNIVKKYSSYYSGPQNYGDVSTF